MRLRAAVAATGLTVAAVLGPAGGVAGATPVQPLGPDDCKVKAGQQLGSLWAQQRLDLVRATSVTQGRDARTGQPVSVAVLDSGLDRRNPQMRGVDAPARLQDAIAQDPGRQYDDCIGHGTQVTAIIAAQPKVGNPFFGVAPEARILPIKLTNKEEVQSADVVRAIDIAIADHAQIANMSLGISADVPALRAAVARAAQHNLLIVAAAGNDGNQGNTIQYPAAYSTQFSNVIAVSGTDAQDAVANFSGSGNFVDVAAPAVGVQSVGVVSGYLPVTGTSFATPFVSGAAALVLAANPGMSAARVRHRIEATADPPPATVPSPTYGYGIVDPYLAITAVHDDTQESSSAGAPTPLAVRPAPRPPDRHLQNIALGVGLALLGLAVLALTGAAVLRGSRGGPRRVGRPVRPS